MYMYMYVQYFMLIHDERYIAASLIMLLWTSSKFLKQTSNNKKNFLSFRYCFTVHETLLSLYILLQRVSTANKKARRNANFSNFI